jgi:hypothetical protein
VWVVLHSGSRGIGNQLAQMHIAKARRLAKDLGQRLEDPDQEALHHRRPGPADARQGVAGRSGPRAGGRDPVRLKDIDQVMADVADLVEVLRTLHQVLDYKGT